MKQNLFNKLWLRVGMIVAIMTTALSGTVWADTVTFSYSDYKGKGTQSTGSEYTMAKNDVSITNTKFYGNTSYAHFYANGTTTITPAANVTITQIVLTASAASYNGYQSNGTITASTGEVSGSNTTVTWTGSATAAFTLSNNKQIRWTSIVVTYTKAGNTSSCEMPTFSPSAGTYTTSQNVTISTETSGATIYYTTDGTTPTTSSSVYSSAIPVSTTTTIKAIAAKSGMNASAAAEATYTIVSIEHAGTEADPYTVADARNAIDANVGITNVYATGIVSKIVTAYNSQYGNISYNISVDGTTEADQLQAFRGKSYNGDDFTSADDIQVGDEVVVYGTLTKYNSTYEFEADNQLVSLNRPAADPVINAEDVDIAYDATSGAIEYTISNPVEGTSLNASTTETWLTLGTISETSVAFTCEENEDEEDRTATITLTYGEVTKDVTVTQAAYVAPVADYAELPFEFDGGKSEIENTAGLTQSGLGGDYGSSPKLKFDGTGDYLVLKINERPGILTFDIKGNSFSGGTFKIQASADGETYTDVATYTTLGETDSETIRNLGEDVRYIKWVYTEKSAGNVALGNIALAVYTEPTGPTVTIGTHTNVTSVAMWLNDNDLTDINSGDEVAAGTEVFVLPTAAEGYEVESVTVVDASNNSVNVTENSENWSFVMPNSSVTVTVTAVQSSVTPPTPTGNKYVKVTSTDDLTDGQYLIVYEEGSVAFDGGLETLDAVGNTIEVTISNNEIAATSATTAAEFTIDVTAGTIQSASGKYIYASSYNNELKSSTSVPTQTNTFSFDSGNAVISVLVNETQSVTLRYNSASNQTRFRYYKSGQEAIQLYKKVEATPETRTLNAQGYATFASTSAVNFDNTGITAWAVTAVSGSTITFAQVTGNIAAETGLLLKGAADATISPETVASGNTPASNLLEAIVEDTPVNAYEYYGLSGQNFVKVKAGTVKAGRALLPASALTSGVKTFTFNFDDDATGISTVETFTEEGAIYNLAGQRLQKMQKGINIVNGKKVLK